MEFFRQAKQLVLSTDIGAGHASVFQKRVEAGKQPSTALAGLPCLPLTLSSVGAFSYFKFLQALRTCTCGS